MIAFVTNRPGIAADDLYAMGPDGSAQVNLSNDPATDGGAAWSPDGTRIAFTTNPDGNDEIYLMNTDGSGQVNLTNNLAQDIEEVGRCSRCARS